MKRREFIIGTTLGLTAVQVPSPLVARVKFSGNPFTLGVASGDVTEDSVVLWTRLAPEPLAADGGIKDGAIPVHWELFQDETMQTPIRQGEELAIPQLAHSVHVDVQNLGPRSGILVPVFRGQTHLGTGSYKDPARSAGSQAASIRFVTASCQNYTHGYFIAYDHIIADNPDFVVHLGDYIYETSYDETFRRHETEAMPLTLDGYRRRHALYKTDESPQTGSRQSAFLLPH